VQSAVKSTQAIEQIGVLTLILIKCTMHVTHECCWLPLPEPVYMNKLGKVVEKGDPSAYGLPVMNELIHPDWLLFTDEMGINTNQKEDGHNGGEKYMCTPGTTPKIACATNEHRATIIPFVAASGHTVICAIIFQGESNNIPSSWILGRDITVTNPVCNDKGEIIQGEINAGKGNISPADLLVTSVVARSLANTT